MKNQGFLSLVFVLMVCTLSLARAADPAPLVSKTHVGVSGPVMLVDGEAFWGAQLTLLHQISPSVELGLESGYWRWSDSGRATSASQSIIPIVPTAIYSFDVDKEFTPFVGLGLGLAIISTDVQLGGLSATGSGTKFQEVTHVGAKFGADQRFFADLRFGVVSDSFTFGPSIGWFF